MSGLVTAGVTRVIAEAGWGRERGAGMARTRELGEG